MKKIIEFLKANILVIKWTIAYIFVLWAILWYLFHFNIFSSTYWWKFSHAHFHNFIGFVFCLIIYSAIPIYIAVTAIIYRTKKPVFTIPFYDKIAERIKKAFEKPAPEPENESEPEEPVAEPISEYPEDLPNELHVPFKRVKEKLVFLGAQSVYDKAASDSATIDAQSEPEAFPIPTDFDIGDSLPDTSVPTFTEINFDTPAQPAPEPEQKIENAVTKHFDKNNTEYETYEDFIITPTQIIYVHSDPDFWIFDEDNWFAAGKQIDSPIPTMLTLAHDNNLTPILYLESTNIMDLDGTIKELTNKGITVITDPNKL